MSLLLTKAGLAAYAQADVSGTKLQATHIAIGDGNGTSVSHTSQSDALVNETWRGELQKIEVAASGEVEFEGHVPITVGGWYIRELAIYAGEILLAVGSHPEVWKPAPEAPDKVELVITAPVKFANAAVINLTVDTTKVLASQEHVASKIAEHDADQDAHAAVFASLAEYTGIHAKRRDNPHEVTAEQVGATPASHANQHTNPHGVTAAQVGAYTKAQVNALLPSLEDVGVVSVLGTRTSTGTWTLTNVTIGKPLFVIQSDNGSASLDSLSEIKTISGAWGGATNIAGTYYRMWSNTASASTASTTNIFVVVPIATTVVFDIGTASQNFALRAYQ